MKKTIVLFVTFLINVTLVAQNFEPITLEFVCELKVTSLESELMCETKNTFRHRFYRLDKIGTDFFDFES